MSRENNEISHGRKIAGTDPELIWGWKTFAGCLRAKRRACLIVDSACLRKGITALEIGCGTGVFTEMFAASGAKIIAVDISRHLLNLAKAKNISPENVEFLEKRFEDCDSIGPFDAIIGSSILHHLDIKPALYKIHQMLKPTGKICFAEPNMLNPQIALQKNIPAIKKAMGDSLNETAFFSWRIRSELENVGFTGVQVIPFDWLHPATPVKLIPFVQKAGAVMEKCPVVREFSGSLLISAQKLKKD